MERRQITRIASGAILFAGIAASVVILGRGGFGQSGQGRAAGERILIEDNLTVPMRDGILLRANLWRPREGGPFPVLIYRTPYNKKVEEKSYPTVRHAVERGYAVLIEDVRGRYASEGEFHPYQQEGKDGYDTIEWAARQAWSNGSVGTFGLSYPAAVQWLAALESPPHLKAMVPAMTFSSPRHFFYFGGAFDLSWIAWIWDNIAPDARVRKNLPGPRTDAEVTAEWIKDQERLLNFVPLGELPDFKEAAPFYYEWLRHLPEDSWWDWCELRGKYAQVNAAVLNLSGWYDEAYGPDGATTNFSGLVAARRGETDRRTHLIVGPWVHGVDETSKTNSGERSFEAASVIYYDETTLRWLDHYVKGVDNGVEREPPVRIFVMGRNEWRDENAWPIASRNSSLYLAGASGNARVGGLRWTPPAYTGQPSEFVSDPERPVVNPKTGEPGAHDYRALVDRSDVLTFDSAAVGQDMEVTGPITAEIYLSTDAPDVDLWVRLQEVAQDGTAFNLMSPGADVLRASYRDSSKGRQLLKVGEIYKLVLPNLITSNVFLKGHRVRVQISGSFFPDFARNPQTGELEAVSSKMRKATIRIHHDGAHLSRLVLPVIPERSARK